MIFCRGRFQFDRLTALSKDEEQTCPYFYNA